MSDAPILLEEVPREPLKAVLFHCNDEAFIRRNNITKKLRDRNVEIIRIITGGRINVAGAQALVMIVDVSSQKDRDAARAAAATTGIPLFLLPHQSSGEGWQRLEAFARGTPISEESAVAPSLERDVLPVSDAEELARAYALDVEEKKAEVSRVRAELAAVITDRDLSERARASLEKRLAEAESQLANVTADLARALEARDKAVERGKRLAEEKQVLLGEKFKIERELADLSSRYKSDSMKLEGAETAIARLKEQLAEKRADEEKMSKEIQAKVNERISKEVKSLTKSERTKMLGLPNTRIDLATDDITSFEKEILQNVQLTERFEKLFGKPGMGFEDYANRLDYLIGIKEAFELHGKIQENEKQLAARNEEWNKNADEIIAMAKVVDEATGYLEKVKGAVEAELIQAGDALAKIFARFGVK